MADICEICMKPLEHLTDGVPNYNDCNEIILCSKCNEEVDELSDKHEGKKEFEKCVEELRKIKNWEKR